MKTINLLFDYSQYLNEKRIPKNYILIPCYRMSLETGKDAVQFNDFMEIVSIAVEKTYPEQVEILTHVAVLEQERVSYPESSEINNLMMHWTDRKRNSSRDENAHFVHKNNLFMVKLEEYESVIIEEHAFHVSRTISKSKRFHSIYKYGQ